MVEILPNLLLGSMSDVLYLLGKQSSRKVTHLLSILTTPIDWSEIHTSQGSLMAKLVSAPDLPSTDLLSHFPSCMSFISEGRDHGVVLVHCEYGISRSATIVLAYVMQSKKLSLSSALEFVKERKPDIRPNGGFIQQLKLWETMKFELKDAHKPYRAYKLHHQAHVMKESGYMKSMELAIDPAGTVAPAQYSCRKCRRALFDNSNVLQHELGTGFVSYKPNKTWWTMNEEAETEDVKGSDVVLLEEIIDPPSASKDELLRLNELKRLRLEVAQIAKQSHDNHMTCTSLFIEPVEWMAPLLLGHKDGKLLCPKCYSRIGSFDWAGSQCSCGQWVTPAFQIHKSKIDMTYSKPDK